jgi:hypothetical protein
MLIVMNPPAEPKDRILINPEQVVCVHPAYGRKDPVNTDTMIWQISVDMSSGQSYSVAFDEERNAREVEKAIMKYMGSVVEPEMVKVVEGGG